MLFKIPNDDILDALLNATSIDKRATRSIQIVLMIGLLQKFNCYLSLDCDDGKLEQISISIERLHIKTFAECFQSELEYEDDEEVIYNIWNLPFDCPVEIRGGNDSPLTSFIAGEFNDDGTFQMLKFSPDGIFDYTSLAFNTKSPHAETLAAYLHHPAKIAKWLEDGNELEDYLQ